MQKRRKPQVIESVARIVARNPDATVRGIAAETGLSKSETGRILQRPVTRQRVAELLAADGAAGHTGRSIGQILAALAAVTEDMLTAGIQEDLEISKLLQLLAALTTTAERLARAGLDLDAVRDPGDDTALRAELAAAYARGMRAALRWPGQAKRAAARIERDTAGPPTRGRR